MPGERTHMLLLHCPLSSGYVLGVELSFSFLVGTETKKQETDALIHSHLEINIENKKLDFPKAITHKHFITPATPLLHLKTTNKTSSNPEFAGR